MKSLPFLTIFLFLACSSSSQMNIHAGKMIVPGQGTDEVSVGMGQDMVMDRLGQPETVEADGKWLNYQEKSGLGFRLDNLQNISEIHFYQSFRGRLPSRVQVGSKTLDVFKAYGTPTERPEVPTGAEGTADRVLYTTPDGCRISYNQLGLAFWFSPNKRVTRIVVFKPLPDRSIRIKPYDVEN